MISGNTFHTNMEYYKVFYYVVKLKNITLAAERMSLSQPNVTKIIQRLEEDLGCKLFTRSRRGVSLTTDGAALWSRIESACELVVSAERELESIQTLESGTLNVAALEMGFTSYILPALSLFRKKYPKVRITFKNAMPDQILEMIKSGLIDLAVLSPLEGLGDVFDCRQIDEFQECLIVGPKFAHLAQREYSLEELMQYPFISMLDGSPGNEYMKKSFREVGLIYKPDIEVSSMEFILQAAAADFGIGTVPEPVARSYVENGTLFALKLNASLPTRKVLAVTKRDFPLSRATKVFLEEFLLGSSQN